MVICHEMIEKQIDKIYINLITKKQKQKKRKGKEMRKKSKQFVQDGKQGNNNIK